MSMDMLTDQGVAYMTATKDELFWVLEAYFQNDEAGWDVPGGWVGWRDRAAKLVGRPTSEQLKEMKQDVPVLPVR